MKIIEETKYLTIGEVAKKIGRGAQTIKNWYAWKETTEDHEPMMDVLPEFFILDGKGTRYFKESDIEKLVEFRDGIKYGAMSDFNRDKWGQRGKEIKENLSKGEKAV